MSNYYQDDQVTLHHGDATVELQQMRSESVNCIVTSPPYYGLRDYGEDGQIGAEQSPTEFVNALVGVFREARRVLANDGTLWLNLGDSYASNISNNGGYSAKSRLRGGRISPGEKHRTANESGQRRALLPGVAPKNLLGIPWRVAFALQDDGWILRNDIIWSKPNAMPESVTDRLGNRHEHLFMFSKKQHYWFDLDPIREPHTSAHDRAGVSAFRGQKAMRDAGPNSGQYSAGGRNPGDVWKIPTQPYPGAHFAVFPLALPERAILAGCKPAGTVLDPFSGSGTTGLAAAKHGRHYIGIDLNSNYLDLSLKDRLAQPTLDFAT